MAEKDAQNKPETRNTDARKPKRTQKRPIWQRWKQSTLTNKITALGAIVGAIFTAAYASVFFADRIIDWFRYREEHGPAIIHSRPPQFIQAITCTSGSGLTYGNADFYVRNVGDRTANNVDPFIIEQKVIPVIKTGNHFWDDVPALQCNASSPSNNALAFSLLPRQEKVVHMRQGVVSINTSIKNGDLVQFYVDECVSYSSPNGVRSTCDVYRFYVPSENPHDTSLGTPEFACDGSPKIGTFRQALTGNCMK